MTDSGDDALPREVSRAIMTFGNLELEVVHLDNGQRIVTEESMERFFAWLEDGGIMNVTPRGSDDTD